MNARLVCTGAGVVWRAAALSTWAGDLGCLLVLRIVPQGVLGFDAC